MLHPDEQAAFRQSVENVREATARHLTVHHGEASVIGFVRHLQQGVERAVNDAVRDGRHIDCKAGCSHCCSTRVDAIAPEVFRIAAELDRRPEAERRETVARLQDHVASNDARARPWSERRSCPFLSDRLCSIYEVRPAACRKAHSIDVGRCEAGAPVIPQHLEIVLKTEALMQGASAAYREHGVDASGHELVRAVLLAMTDPSATARWLNGEMVFEAEVEALSKPTEHPR